MRFASLFALPLVVGFAACAGEFTSIDGPNPKDDAAPPSEDASSGGSSSSGSPGGSSSSSGTPASSGGSSSGVSSGAVSYELTAEEQAMLNRINEVRRDYAPGASPPLNPVIWDYSIGLALRGWATNCASAAPPLPGGTTTTYGPLDARMSVDQLLTALLDSRQYYDLASNQCTLGASQCEGYTNMVQRGVSRVACVFGAQTCPAPMPEGGDNVVWRNWACTYAPLPDSTARPY